MGRIEGARHAGHGAFHPPAGELNELFRPRRRPLLRLALGIGVCAVLFASGVIVAWLRFNVVPPGCEDPETVASVKQSLAEHFKLPGNIGLETIQTVAGGYVAFRFVCEASIVGIDRDALPPGSDVPGTVDYVSQLTPDHRRHEVTVKIHPALIWEFQQ